MGRYILDFYCPELRVAVELDGAGHKGFGGYQTEKDRIRDEYLKNECGVIVLRFENKQVFKTPKYVVDCIEEEIKKQGGVVAPFDWSAWQNGNSLFSQTPFPLRGTPPEAGGESEARLECSPETGELSGGLRGGYVDGMVTPSPLRGTPPEAGGESIVEGCSRLYHSRPMDIDLIFFNDEVVDLPDLQIPHPRAHLRRFVLEPLAEIMPDYIHPTLHRTVRQLLDDLG